jgi:hypothetical protein
MPMIENYNFKNYFVFPLFSFVLLFIVDTAFAQNNSVFNKKPMLILSGNAGDGHGEFGTTGQGNGIGPMDFAVDSKMNIWSGNVQATTENNVSIQARANNKTTLNDKKNNEHEKKDQTKVSEVEDDKQEITTITFAGYRKQYSDFVKKINLSNEDSEEFFRLLSLTNSVVQDAANKTNTRDETREFVNNTFKNLEDFLGEKNYAAYEEYEKLKNARSVVNGLNKLLDHGDQLKDEQKEEMIQSINAAQEHFISNPPEYNINDIPEGMSKNTYETFLYYKSCLDSHKNILSDGQYKKLKQYFDDSIKQQMSYDRDAALMR